MLVVEVLRGRQARQFPCRKYLQYGIAWTVLVLGGDEAVAAVAPVSEVDMLHKVITVAKALWPLSCPTILC